MKFLEKLTVYMKVNIPTKQNIFIKKIKTNKQKNVLKNKLKLLRIEMGGDNIITIGVQKM